jgi:hypothetical protein
MIQGRKLKNKRARTQALGWALARRTTVKCSSLDDFKSPPRLAWPNRPKIICSPSYVDIRSRANTTRGLDYKLMIKARAHKGGVRIGKTPKKLASICCP